MRSISGVKKGVILLSGGIDSAVTLYLAKHQGYQLTALIFDYNQRHRKEIKCAKRVANLNKVKHYLIKCDLSWVKSSLTNKTIKIGSEAKLGYKKIPFTYVSGRNIIFLSYAASFAESIKAKAIFIGAHVHDYSGYPDCRAEFLDSFQEALNLGMKNKRMRIIAPLINKDKKGIIKSGLKLGVPFEYTWSCYQGKKIPCGKCDSCRFRARAFYQLGLIDPIKA